MKTIPPDLSCPLCSPKTGVFSGTTNGKATLSFLDKPPRFDAVRFFKVKIGRHQVVHFPDSRYSRDTRSIFIEFNSYIGMKIMKILVTGGCGNMGPHIIHKLASLGHDVRVLDRDQQGLKPFSASGFETCCGDLADREWVRSAVNGTDAVIHLAWSFSDNLPDLLDTDVKGYQHLLDAAVEYGVSHVVNTTTAVSYGKPLSLPVVESQAHQVELSRSPVYALAKYMTEELGKIYAVQHGICVNNFMVWYAYGDVIGGRNIRAMIRDAIEKGRIEVPARSGGSFLQLDDFVTCALAAFSSDIKGELFNVASLYLTWEEVAKLITSLVNPDARVIAVEPAEWKGSAFLTDDWPLSTRKAEEQLHFTTGLSRQEAINQLLAALKKSADKVRASL